MKLSKDIQNQVINEVIAGWATEELSYYFERVKKVGKATGEGARDIHVQTIKATTSRLAHVMFSFKDYMRFQDMKKLDNTHTPLPALLEWIDAKGIGKFKAGYRRRYGRVPSTDVQLMNAVAWGMMRGKRRKHRRKSWYQKSKWKGINVLESRLLDKLGDATLQFTKKSIENVNQKG